MVNLGKLKIGGSLVIAGDLYNGKVVGVNFEPAKSNFHKLVEKFNKGDNFDFNISLVAEPENKFDKNAIAVHSNGLKIGYIPKEVNTKILEHGLDKAKAKFWKWNEMKPGDIKGMEIHVAA